MENCRTFLALRFPGHIMWLANTLMAQEIHGHNKNLKKKEIDDLNYLDFRKLFTYCREEINCRQNVV